MRDSDIELPCAKALRSEVLRYLGRRGHEVGEELEKRVDAMTERCIKSARIKRCHELFEIAVTEDGVTLKGTGVTFQGNDIRRYCGGASRCAVIGGTLGADVERELARLETLSVTDALIFNSACTALIEWVMDIEEAEVREGQTRKKGGRFSPGYGDFPLSQQPEVLSLLNARARLGITLTKDLIMIPRKSVTAVVAL